MSSPVPAVSKSPSKTAKKSPPSPPKDDKPASLANGSARSSVTSQKGSTAGRPPPNQPKDYWHKNGREQVDKTKPGFYPRTGGDRWSSRPNPHAPPKLTPAQRKARGPLPDWDDVQVVIKKAFFR